MSMRVSVYGRGCEHNERREETYTVELLLLSRSTYDDARARLTKSLNKPGGDCGPKADRAAAMLMHQTVTDAASMLDSQLQEAADRRRK